MPRGYDGAVGLDTLAGARYSTNEKNARYSTNEKNARWRSLLDQREGSLVE
jgi:hypothetical protein